MRRLPLLILTLLGGALASGLRSSEARAPGSDEGEVDFLRQVRPILADKCFACHGPDESTREADLRLDTREGLFGDLGGYAAVTPGDLDASEIIYRVSNEDEAERMPPAETGKQLTAEEIEVIRRWIEDGAEWNTHWAFEAPARPEPPAVSDESWPRNEIDRFVLARLEAEGLAPAPEADKEELLRRVTFDLTGLPPTLGEIDAFLLDTGEDAYEKVVDRLLASPRYGERQAQEWLDLARFADSNGDGYDGTRQMWKWREWVIQAFNGNKPFDEFTIEQIAGDLLPDATRDQRLATGFHRNHTIFTKGGQAPDEYRHAYVIDRVNTTATVWMGLTLGCAQCHDHKYDPFSQRDYYRLYAYFNNVSESDVGRGNGNSPPYMHVPDDEQAVKLDELAAGIETLEAELTADHEEWDAAEAAWVDETLGRMETERVEWTTLEPSGFLSLGGSLLKRLDDGSFLATGPNPAQEVYHLVAHPGKGRITAFRLEVLPQESFPKGGSGRSEKGRFTLSEFEVYLSSVAQGDDGEKIRFHRAEDDVQHERSIDADKAVDGSKSTGWGLIGDEITSDHQAIFLPVEPLELNQNSVLRFVLDQRFRYRYRNTIGRFRISYTDDDDIVKRRLKVVPSTWRALGPFAAKTREEAFTTAFDPEQDIPEGVDLDKKYVKILLEDEKEKGSKGGEKKADEAAPSAAAPAAEPADEREPDPEDFADFDFEDFADFDFSAYGQKKDTKNVVWKEEKDWRDGGRIKLDGKHSAWYLHRKLETDEERDVRVLFEGFNGIRAWLGGELVFEQAPEEEPEKRYGSFGAFADVDFDDDDALDKLAKRVPDYDSFELSLPAGESELVLKVVTGKNGARTRIRLQPIGRDVVSLAASRAMTAQAETDAEPEPFDSSTEGASEAEIVEAAAPVPHEPRDMKEAQAEEPREDEAVAQARKEDQAEARRKLVREWFRRYASPLAGPKYAELDSLRFAKKKLEQGIPTAMVLDEKKPRDTHVLVRGAYDQKGEKVESGIPAVLPPLATDAPANRLGLARWLVSPEHPLTARVTVNRVWRQYFGTGLVATTNDFGTRGALPENQELLDGLATDFVAGAWDVKALHRKIVTSATYRQASATTPELLERDPKNVLLARGPRLRLSAEMIRDNALAVSALLVEELGGESVKPYQPKGLWKGVGGQQARGYKQDEGEKLYRRGIYVFWKRGVLYPSFAIFDAPTRVTCVSERVETNTPLQSLVLMNDPVFVEAARALGARMMTEGGSDRSSRLIYGFRQCTSRMPTQQELIVLLRVVDEQLKHYAEDEQAAQAFVSVGESEPPEELDVKELAAWTAIGNLLLNLDAAIHRS